MHQAYYVACVHSVTGLTEDIILWDLPLARGLAYQHAALTREGVDLQWPGEDDSTDLIKKVRDLIKRKPWRR